MRFIDDLYTDTRHGLRGLRRTQGFTALAVLTLACGIGATTSVYSVMQGLLLTPLAYPDSERLTYVYQTERGEEGVGNLSIRNFFDIKERARSFDALAATGGWFDPAFVRGDVPVRLNGAFGSTELFHVLGVHPAQGRGFAPGDGSDVVVVSHAFAQTYYPDRQSIVGETIALDNVPMVIIGVMPEGFRGPAHLDAEVWRHYPVAPSGQRGSRNMAVLGRLRAGVDAAAAAHELRSIIAALSAEHPAILDETGVGLRALHEQIFGDTRRPLAILLAAAGLLLLVGGVNLSSLMLARATARHRGIVVRLAIGADRGRVIRLLLTEGALIVAMGGALGLLLAHWVTRGLIAIGPEVLRAREIGVDGGVLLFSVAVMVLTVPTVALMPALRASRARLADSLGNRGVGSSGRGDLQVRDALVAVQLALTMVLLAAGGALARHLSQLLRAEPGFQSRDVSSAELSLSPTAFPGVASSVFLHELIREVGALPGVEAVGVTSLLPFAGDYFTTGVRVEGRVYEGDDYGEMVDRVIASPEYLPMLGVPLVQGRWLRDGDDAQAPRVALISTHLATALFGDANPLGRRIRLSFADSAIQVAGVVGNVSMESLDESPRSQVYLPLAQAVTYEARLVVRSPRDAGTLVAELRQAAARVRSDQPIGEVISLDELLARSRQPIRFLTILLAALAVVAMIIATAGAYGVSAYMTQTRRQEFGIRRALGAQATDILVLVLRGASRRIGLGVACGVLAAVAVERAIAGLVADVGLGDSAVLVAVASVLAAISVLASVLPALRIGRIEPRYLMADE